jgi:hypothetical protein
MQNVFCREGVLNLTYVAMRNSTSVINDFDVIEIRNPNIEIRNKFKIQT